MSENEIFSFYTGGVKEGSGNYVVLLKSDDGTSFGDPIAVVYKEGNYRCLDGCLWIDPLGRLWFTWAVMPENATYGVICDDPDAEDIVWGEVFRIGYGVMLNKPIVLCTGEWMFPIAIWKPEAYAWLPKEFISSGKKGSYVYKSTDKGKSFEILGIADDFSSKDCDEHMVIELNDGRLAMYIRTLVGIAVCYSRDRGKTWSKPDKSVLSGPGSRFFIRRLHAENWAHTTETMIFIQIPYLKEQRSFCEQKKEMCG